MSDNALLKAIEVGLTSTGPGADVVEDSAAVAAVLTEHGMVLPAGIRIGAVYRVRQDPGYSCTDRGEAERWARDGGTSGQHGDVETAWRIQADGVDATTTWVRATRHPDPREDTA